MKRQKKDLLLVAIVLAIAAAGFLLNAYLHRKPAAYLEVKVDGEIIKTLDLSRDTELVIVSDNGGFNRLVIQNHMAWVTEASCPDKVCVHQGKVQMNGQMISCLPNRMTARVTAPD